MLLRGHRRLSLAFTLAELHAASTRRANSTASVSAFADFGRPSFGSSSRRRGPFQGLAANISW